MTHPGEGIPSGLIQDMFEGGNQCITQEGLGLNLSRKLLNMMHVMSIMSEIWISVTSSLILNLELELHDQGEDQRWTQAERPEFSPQQLNPRMYVSVHVCLE